MNPILFGSRERRLFGIHRPAAGARMRRGVVICQPWGQEYERAHRACGQLGERLAARGCDVLRFDYYGTGDSAGAADEVTLEGCVLDTALAIDELCAIGDLKRVTLVGLRLGAVIAQRASVEAREADRLVLWDPVSDGVEYLHALDAARDAHRSGARAGRVYGYPISDTFRAELEAIAPDRVATRAGRVLLIASEDAPSHRTLVEHLRANGREVEWELRPGAASWAEVAALGVGAIPVEIIDHIASWCA